MCTSNLLLYSNMGKISSMILAVVMAALLTSRVLGDFDCVCNLKDVDTPVYLRPSSHLQPEGYLYMSTCKPVFRLHGNFSELYFELQFERKVVYVEKQPNVELTQCQGDPSRHDLVPTTIQPTNTVTTVATTRPFTDTNTPSSMTLATTAPKTMTLATMTSKTMKPGITHNAITSTSSATTMTSTTLPTTKRTGTTPTTTPQTTMRAVTYMSPVGTPYETIGAGYNLLTGTPDQSTDNGLILRQIFQVTGNNEMGEIRHRHYNTCKSEKSSFLVHSSLSYQNELLQYVKPLAGHPSNLMREALTYSSGFDSVCVTERPNPVTVYIDKDQFDHVQRATEKSNPETVFTDVKYACITDELSADLNYTQITAEFAAAVCSLPLDIMSNLTAYMGFIDTWGTSVVTDASLGLNTIARFGLNLQKIFQMLRQKGLPIQNGGPFRGFASSLITTPAQVQGLHDVGPRTKITTTSTQTNHKPLQLQIVPIFQALDPSYWAPIMGQLVASGKCLSSFDSTMLTKYQANLNETLALYTGYYLNKVGYSRTATDHPLQIPVTWPLGRYGLMEAASGCPAAGTIWSTGYVEQDTEDINPGNRFTSGINQFLSGEFSNQYIQTRYCIRNNAYSTSYDIDWPKGTYCIFRKGGSCPNGFSSGVIFWDDEDVLNRNRHNGTLPDGDFDSNTRIYYCCRNDGPSSTEIALPVDRSFVLIRYTSTCQRVLYMTSRDVHVRWDDEDGSNSDVAQGAHPLDTGGTHNHDIYFCHYQRTAGAAIIG